MTNRHPSEADLALLAGGDCSRLRRFYLNRHVERCGDCRDALASFAELRSTARDSAASGLALDGPDWERMAGEMRANIRVALAAGECVGEAPGDAPRRSWAPRLAVGFAGVLVLAGAGVFLRGLLPHENAADVVARAVMKSTVAGPEVQTAGGSSMTLLLNHGDIAVTAQGGIQSSSVDHGEVIVARVFDGE